jgi:hypothetical protein
MRVALALVAALAALPAVAQETIVIEPLEPATGSVSDILDEIAPLDGAEDGDSTLPQVPDRPAEEAASARGGVVRVLDKISGQVTDLDIATGDTALVESLSVTLLDCRYPVSNPAGDAFILLSIRYRDPDPVFQGWMIASSPAVSAMEHPRYDVWALRCNIS